MATDRYEELRRTVDTVADEAFRIVTESHVQRDADEFPVEWVLIARGSDPDHPSFDMMTSHMATNRVEQLVRDVAQGMGLA